MCVPGGVGEYDGGVSLGGVGVLVGVREVSVCVG